MSQVEINHEELQMKARNMTDDELFFVRDDAKAAWLAMPDNPKGRVYRWEMCYALNEIARRGLAVDGWN